MSWRRAHTFSICYKNVLTRCRYGAASMLINNEHSDNMQRHGSVKPVYRCFLCILIDPSLLFNMTDAPRATIRPHLHYLLFGARVWQYHAILYLLKKHSHHNTPHPPTPPKPANHPPHSPLPPSPFNSLLHSRRHQHVRPSGSSATELVYGHVGEAGSEPLIGEKINK